MAHCTNCGEDMDDCTSVCPCTCKNCKNIVFNHVLAYTQVYLDTYSVVEVTKAIETFFTNEDVAAAREILRRKFDSDLNTLDICKIANRKSSLNRSTMEANAGDITEAVYYLMQMDGPPKFVTFELNKLPLLTPILASTRTQAENVLFLEQKVRRIEERLNEQSSQLMQQSDDINKCQKKLEFKSVAPSAKNAMATPMVPSSLSFTREKDISEPEISQSIGSSALGPRQEQPRPGPSWAEMTSRDLPRDGGPNSSGWEIPRHHRLKQRRASGGTQDSQPVTKTHGRRTQALQGSATNTQLKAGAGPNRDLWIFNVHKDMEDDKLRKFIEDGGSTKEKKVHIRQWQVRYNEFSESKQFRLTIGKVDYDYVYKAEFWPLDISVRKYYLSNEEKAQLKGSKQGAASADLISQSRS